MKENLAFSSGSKEQKQKKRQLGDPNRDFIEPFLIIRSSDKLIENNTEKHNDQTNLQKNADKIGCAVKTLKKNELVQGNSTDGKRLENFSSKMEFIGYFLSRRQIYSVQIPQNGSLK
jgi:hypothetical protein